MKGYRNLVCWLLPALAGLVWAGAPARGQVVEPLISPDEMLSVDQIRPGMKGVGRSVFEGTKIEPFGVTVIGVLRKIDFGGDMILIRIDDGPPVTSGAGVSSGMSGSPIYVDGKLIGALAFAWPFAKQPVAGVTPIAQMLDNYRPGSAPAPPRTAQAGDLRVEGEPLRLDGRLFSRATVVPERSQAAAGGAALTLHPVATPVMVAGMGRVGIEELKRRFTRHPVLFAAGPGRVELPAGERPRLEPGAAVGVQLLGGDIDATAIGTVTYVKGPHVIAFGHPMFGLGSLDMPLTTAYIHGVIPTQEVSFKLGAPVETVGRLTQDRNWSIGGEVGVTPRSIAGEFAVSDRERGVKRDYRITAAVHRDLTPTLLYSALLSAVGSVAPPEGGTTRGSVEVWARGLAPIKRENVYSTSERRSQIEMLFGDPFAGLPLVELLQILDALENNSFGAVPVDRIRVAVEVSEKRQTATIERAYADRKRVKPGDTVKIGVVLRPANGPRETREFDLEVPRNIPGGRLQIGVAAGGAADRVRQFMMITRPPARTLGQLVSLITDREANNELVIELAQPVMGVTASGREFPNLPNVMVEVLTNASATGIRMIRSHTRRTDPTPWVLSGAQLLSLQVEADEKDKSGAAFFPGQGGAPGLTSLLDLFRFGFGGDLGPEFGGDYGEPGADDVALRRRILDRLLTNPNLPLDPKLPTFEELQRVLEGDGGGGLPSGTGGGTVTARKKSVGRGPGVWRLAAARDFQGGKLEGVLVSSRGELGLAPQPTPVLSSPDRLFWAQAGDAEGNVYAGGWLDGSVLKITPDGKSAPFFDREDEVAVTALAVDADGTVLAAAEPSGTIYRITREGRGTVFARLPGRRIWGLCPSGGAVYVATGSEGGLYRIEADGRVAEAFTAPDRHVIALAERNGALYCATYPRGKIFRLRAGRTEPIYELPNLTATSLTLDAAGNLFVGTSPRATVVRITPTGDVTTLFTSREKHVFALVAEPSGDLLAAVGPQARVYRIQPDRTASTLWEPQAAYVLGLCRDAQGRAFATTAGPSQLVRLTPQPEGRGTFTSAVLNAATVARWGAVRWSAGPAGVAIRTRSGNTAYPDSTWSAWSDPYASPAGQPIASPPGQYLQYQVELRGAKDQPAPVLRSVEFFYRARNRAPELTLRAPAAGEALSGTQAIRWRAKDPDGDRLTYDVFYAREGSDKWVKIGTKTGAAPDDEMELEEEAEEEDPLTALRARLGSARPSQPARTAGAARPPGAPRPAATPRPRPVQYGPGYGEAVPPDLGEGGAGLRPGAGEEPDLDEALGSGGSLNWNTKRIPDGRYRIRVVANDSLTSPDEVQTAEALSEVFRIDNSPPQILIKAAKRVWPVPPLEIPAKEATSYIASAEYRVDAGPWIAAAAADGIFDSADEVIRIDPARLPVGRHTLSIRTRDAGGNESVVTTPYVLKQPLPPK